MRLLLLVSLLLLTHSINAQQVVKKVLLEEYTGAWCQWCGEGAAMAHDVEQFLPGKVIVVANHYGDDLQTPLADTFMNVFKIGGFPSGVIDRYTLPGDTNYNFNRIDWQPFVNLRSKSSAIASISFGNCKIMNNGNFDFEVNVQFKVPPASGIPLRINVLVLEDSIPATGNLAQANSSAIVQPGINPMINWFHNNTLRGSLAGNWGSNPFPAQPLAGTVYKQHFSFTRPAAWAAKQIRLVGYVAYNGGVSDNRKEVLNCEQVALKNFQKSSSLQATAQAEIRGLWPNPAGGHSLISLEYSTDVSGLAALYVYNSIGQLVANPYISNDIAGIHTITFYPKDYSLRPGLYFLNLKTEQSTLSMRLLIE